MCEACNGVMLHSVRMANRRTSLQGWSEAGIGMGDQRGILNGFGCHLHSKDVFGLVFQDAIDFVLAALHPPSSSNLSLVAILFFITLFQYIICQKHFAFIGLNYCIIS